MTADCPHDWIRDPNAERSNGPHIFRCTWCEIYGWRKRYRENKKAPPDPIRVYGGKRQEIMRERVAELSRPEISARPMSGRRGMNGGFVPPGSSGGMKG